MISVDPESGTFCLQFWDADSAAMDTTGLGTLLREDQADSRKEGHVSSTVIYYLQRSKAEGQLSTFVFPK